GCSAGEKNPPAPSAGANTGDGVKTGLAVITSIGDSKDAGDADGLAQVNSVVVAVTVGADGKILACKIDTAQTKINFTAQGTLSTPADTVFASKQDLGSAYGMTKASSIGKEWNEQADAFAAYVVGKTIDEVKGISLNNEGVPTEADLTSSVTMHVTDYIAALEKAVGSAQVLGAQQGDALGLGVTTNIANSVDATADKEGLAQAYSTYTAVTFDTAGKITSCIIDASQTNVNFTADGKVSTALDSAFQTKNELGAGYNMAKSSSIGKEWNEQAASFAAYAVGKTASDVAGVAVSEGVPTDADLTSSVTIHISDFLTVIEKAAANKK
ncbi:MAG: hypothetical protein PHO66_07030, partial [Eubacteriales bacterium]|nr:hypothetical protein [Eubacteriales bacterium]